MLGRRLWVIAHRCAGLTLALFLAVAGATGALLAFHDELDTFFASRLHRIAEPAAGAAMMEPLALRDRVLAQFPGGTINYLPLQREAGRTVPLQVERLNPETRTLEPWSEEWDELFVNPYTGEIVGHRKLGNIGQGAINLMPFLYRLHYGLVFGSYGILAFGIAALIWTVDCFVGFYLTFPARPPRGTAAVPTWLSRWKPSWLVRSRTGAHRFTVDLHRAGGLWLWPLLLVFAWSSVSFNLGQVYEPVMHSFGYERLAEGIVPPIAPRFSPRIDFAAALRHGEELARSEAARFGLSIDATRETGLLHRPDGGVYSYIFSSSADFRTTGGRSLAIFDSDTGELLKLVLPEGQNGANTVTEWITALHVGAVWGLPYRVVVSVVGLMVTMLSVTGVLIWARKRSARIVRRGASG